MVPNEEENTGGAAPASVPAVVIEQARDIGDATARLEMLTAAHDATKAIAEDARSSASFAHDRISTLESTVSRMADDLAALKPVAAAEAGAEGAAEETGAAIDTIDPQPAAHNPGEKKRGALAWIHDKLS